MSDDLVKWLRSWRRQMYNTGWLHLADRMETVADRIEALTAKLAEVQANLKTALDREAATTARYDAKLAEVEAERDEWRSDFRALEKAIIGDTGLSAMTVAIQAKLFRPRAEAAEAKLKEVEAERDHALSYGPKVKLWLEHAESDRDGWKRRAEAAEARERDAYRRGFKAALNASAIELECNWGHIATPEMRDAIRAIPLPDK